MFPLLTFTLLTFTFLWIIYKLAYNNKSFILFIFSPERSDALQQGRARSHARHSSGSFDIEKWGIQMNDHTTQDITQDITQKGNQVEKELGTVPIPTSTTDTDTTTNENTNLATAALPTPDTDTTATNTTTDTTTNHTELDLGEKFGEGEGEDSGWQGVMGRHSARKKKAHFSAQQVLLLSLLFLNTRAHTDL